MTDKVIIKGLDHCSSSGECKACPANPRVGNFGYCTGLLMKAAIDLINRQKAEIERLRQANADICEAGGKLLREHKTIRAETIKEFAEMLKEELTTGAAIMRVSVLGIIDDLVKEMTEGDNG